jgi:endonuclease III
MRLGIVREERSYAANYAAAQRAAAGELGDDVDVLITAHRLLRQHGQTLCRRSAPACDRCPLKAECAFAAQRER